MIIYCFRQVWVVFGGIYSQMIIIRSRGKESNVGKSYKYDKVFIDYNNILQLYFPQLIILFNYKWYKWYKGYKEYNIIIK